MKKQHEESEAQELSQTQEHPLGEGSQPAHEAQEEPQHEVHDENPDETPDESPDETPSKKRHRKHSRAGASYARSTVYRTLTALGVIALVCVGLAVHTGVGTPSQWGIGDIAALCPLGAVETFVASRTFIPPMLIALAIVALATIILGRVFCAWGCPVPLLRRVLGLKSPEERRQLKAKKQERVERVDPAEKQAQGSRNWVLGGVVLASAAFGFPVFCIICPVGLSFATLIAFWRLFQFDETTLSLIVFPAILLVELIVARRWCHRICPLGALLSLISRLNKTFRPQINAASCLHVKGESCRHCAEVCPEGIDFHNKEQSAPLADCTKCRICSDKCPSHAISFPLLPSKK